MRKTIIYAKLITKINVMDTEVRVRVIADCIKIRKSPHPWAECVKVADKGGNFKYTGHYP